MQFRQLTRGPNKLPPVATIGHHIKKKTFAHTHTSNDENGIKFVVLKGKVKTAIFPLAFLLLLFWRLIVLVYPRTLACFIRAATNTSPKYVSLAIMN